jgi:alanine racemase
MSRPARITVDLEALRHNLRWLRTRHGGRVLAVLKANAYGHGAAPCAAALGRGSRRTAACVPRCG